MCLDTVSLQKKGFNFIIGRMDDVINVGAHCTIMDDSFDKHETMVIDLAKLRLPFIHEFLLNLLADQASIFLRAKVENTNCKERPHNAYIRCWSSSVCIQGIVKHLLVSSDHQLRCTLYRCNGSTIVYDQISFLQGFPVLSDQFHPVLSDPFQLFHLQLVLHLPRFHLLPSRSFFFSRNCLEGTNV
jgi:hypothetical protein